jgi:hypothetical protein
LAKNAEIPLEFKHIEEILRFAAEDGPTGKELSLPLGWTVLREPEAMVFFVLTRPGSRALRMIKTTFLIPRLRIR